jgi:formamidopyrimidine-DNA glycosylase
MPELPEIEHLRRTLARHLVGARVLRVELRRRDIVRRAGSRKAVRAVGKHDLLEGAVVRDLLRRGKSLVLVVDDPRVLALHMGMTGNMSITRDDGESTSTSSLASKHVHCEWLLRTRRGQRVRMRFRDPRRFGGLWPFASMDDLHRRGWSRLGPDALSINAATLRSRLLRTRQPIKAALLNQALIAGIGNIYADESLFAARIHPCRGPQSLERNEWRRLAGAIRRVLRLAIEAGGSTIRDYADSSGAAGRFTGKHRVYGRTGCACTRCRHSLRSMTVGQRTTVFCHRCQPR